MRPLKVLQTKSLEAANGGVLSKKMFLKILQISQENTCVEVYFPSLRPATLLKRDSNTGAFLWSRWNSYKTPTLTEHLRTAAS